MLKKLFAVAVLACLTTVGILSHAEVSVGDQAPDFSLAGSDGAVHTLADLRGKYVVVAFFPKAYTKG